ncbi:MAG: hypothetical protein ABR905_08880 [Terracidiphilus sp.]|jgi:hypothetical protein
MPDADALAKYYETLTDSQLLNLRAEDGLTEQADLMLTEELKRRNLTTGDMKRNTAYNNRTNLLDKAQERGSSSKGPGLLFFGNRCLNEADKTANIRLRTKWFALGGMPIVPLASYRFKCKGIPGKWFWGDAEQRVINRVPLNWPQVFLTWAKTTLLILLFFLFLVGFSWFQEHRIR